MSIDEALAIWCKNLKSAPMTPNDHVKWVKRSRVAIAKIDGCPDSPPDSADGPEAERLSEPKPDDVKDNADEDPAERLRTLLDDVVGNAVDVLDAGQNEEPEEKPEAPMDALRGRRSKRKTK